MPSSRPSFVWFVAVVSLIVLIMFSAYVSQDMVTACRFSYNYSLGLNNQTIIDSDKLVAENPPTVQVNLWFSYHLSDGKIDPIWLRYLTENNANIYFPRGVDDQSAAIFEGVLFGLTFPYQNCNWILVRVYPRDQ